MQETVAKTPKQLRDAEYGKRRRQDPEYKRKAAERAKRWREKNPEWSRSNTKEWRQKNKAYVAAYVAERYALNKKAVAAWTDVDMQRKILELYETAAKLTQATNIQHQVDHIVPLRGKTVCGLHVWWNLRVVPASQNKNKSAKFDPNLWPEQAELAFT